MKYYLFILLGFLFTNFIFAQAKFSISKIYESDANHSLYDALLLKDSSVIAVGEKGYLQLKKNNSSYLVDSFYGIPNLYSSIYFNECPIFLGDSLYYKKLKEHCNPNSYLEKIPNQNYCTYNAISFYSYLVAAQFKSGIAHAKKMIPFGKIKIYDSNFNIVAKSNFNFSVIWDFYTQDSALFAIKYNPIFGSCILSFTRNKKWRKEKRYPYLLQKAFTFGQTKLYCGSKNFRLKEGIIVANDKVYPIKASGIIWDVIEIQNMTIAVGNHGKIFYKLKTENQFNILETGYDIALYDILQINKNELLIVGHKGLILNLMIW